MIVEVGWMVATGEKPVLTVPRVGGLAGMVGYEDLGKAGRASGGRPGGFLPVSAGEGEEIRKVWVMGKVVRLGLPEPARVGA